MDDWKFGPPILVGERVLWVKNSVKPTESGVVRWIGKLSKESGDWTVGVELDNAMACGGTDGSLGSRKLFHCQPGKGVFLPLSRIRKEVTKDKLKDTNGKSFALKLHALKRDTCIIAYSSAVSAKTVTILDYRITRDPCVRRGTDDSLYLQQP